MLFDALSFTVAPGGAAVVTGPNGVGKSSLLRLLAGLLVPAAGTIDRPDRLSWLGEQAALDHDRTLRQALDFWATLDGGGDGGGDGAAALARVDLAALADIPVRLLSTGQRRRAAIARVVASRAPLWLLDEPANGLDAAAGERLAALIADHRAGGGAVVVATHVPIALPGAATVTLA